MGDGGDGRRGKKEEIKKNIQQLRINIFLK